MILQAYFVTNMESIKFWEFVSLILEGLGYQRCFFIFYSFSLKNAPSCCHVYAKSQKNTVGLLY